MRRALLACALLLAACGHPRAALVTAPEAAGWAPLLVAPTPPAAPARRDLDAVLRWQQRRTAADRAAMAYWHAGAPAWRWDAEARRLADGGLMPTVAAARLFAAVHVAMADACLSCWRAMASEGLPAPAALDPRVHPLLEAAPDPSWPSAHAAVARAAAEVLAAAFPQEAASLRTKAAAVAETRVAAGLAFPEDVAAGDALGRAVAAAVNAKLAADGDGRGPAPVGAFHDPEAELPRAGAWSTWLGVQPALPSPPPTGERAAALAEVVALNRHLSIAPRNLADKWLDGEPAARWSQRAAELVERHQADLMHGTRLLARVAAGAADAAIFSWRLAYQDLAPRPRALAPDLEPIRFTPVHPAWPDDAAAIAAASADLLGRAYPDEAPQLEREAVEAAEAGFDGAQHYRRDGQDGRALGRALAAAVREP